MSERDIIRQLSKRQPERANIAEIERRRRQDSESEVKKEVVQRGVDMSRYEKLDSGEYVDKEEFQKLSGADQGRLKTLGIDGFNDYYKEQETKFKAANVQLSYGDWVDKKSYNSLHSIWKNKINQFGVSGFNNWLKTAYGGVKDYIIARDPMSGQDVIFGKTENPNIGIDETGTRIFLGDRWGAASEYTGLEGDLVPSLQPPPKPSIEVVEGVNIWTGDRWPESTLPERLQTVAILDTGVGLPTKITQGDIEAGRWIKTDIGEFVKKEEYEGLSEDEQKVLKEQGFESLKELKKQDYVEIKGELVDKKYVNELSEDDRKLLNDLGVTKFIEHKEQKFKSENIQLKSGEWVTKSDFEALPQPMQDAVMNYGLKAIDMQSLPPEKQFEKMQQFGLVPMNVEYGGVDEEGNLLVKAEQKGIEIEKPWYEQFLNAEFAKGVGIGMIPIAGTIYHWKNSEWWQNGLSVVADVATFIPITTGVAAGVRAGRGLWTSLGRVALAELKAPITMITRPVGTAKTGIRTLDTVVRPMHVPLASSEIRSYILKIPSSVVDDIGDAKTAMKARDVLTDAAIRGQNPVIQVADKEIKLAKVAMNQPLEVAAFHSAPDITPFLTGTTIRKGDEGLGLFVTSSVNSRLTHADAFGRGYIPAPEIGTFEWTGRNIRKIGDYRPQDIAALDKVPIRKLDLSDSNNIPKDIAAPLLKYIRDNDGVIVGSFAERIRLKNAPKPNDVDLNFVNPIKARQDIANIAKNSGYKVEVKASAVVITDKSGATKEIANVKANRKAFFDMHGLKEVPMQKVDGVNVIPLGEQYMRQAFGAAAAEGVDIATFQKRAEHMLKSSLELAKLIKENGLTKRMRGALIIRDEKVLAQMQPSGKLYRGTLEIEETIKPLTELPSPSQILTTRDAAGNLLYLAVIGKPFSASQIAKIKFMGAVDTVRDIFRPAMTIEGKGVEVVDELRGLAAEATRLKDKIKYADSIGDISEVSKLRRELSSVNSRARAISRQVDQAAASRTSLRAIGVSTGEYLDRISYREVARGNPDVFAIRLREMSEIDRNRIVNELDRETAIRVRNELDRINIRLPSRGDIVRAERMIPDVPRITRTVEPIREPIRIPTDRITVEPPRYIPPDVPTRLPPRVPPTRFPPRVPPKISPPIIPPSSRDYEYFAEHGLPEGSLAWKQGIIYRHWMPPYRKAKEHPQDWFFSRKPIPGVPYAEGVGSAYASIVALGGKNIPDELHYEMGLQKLTIKKKAGSDEPAIFFELDEGDASWSPEKKAEREAKELKEEAKKPKTIEVEGQKYVAVKPKKQAERRQMTVSESQQVLKDAGLLDRRKVLGARPLTVSESQDILREAGYIGKESVPEVRKSVAEIKTEALERKSITSESKSVVMEASKRVGVETKYGDIFGGEDAFEVGRDAFEVNNIDAGKDAFEVGDVYNQTDIQTEESKNIIPQWREESTVQPVSKKPVQSVKKSKVQESIRLIR